MLQPEEEEEGRREMVQRESQRDCKHEKDSMHPYCSEMSGVTHKDWQKPLGDRTTPDDSQQGNGDLSLSTVRN